MSSKEPSNHSFDSIYEKNLGTRLAVIEEIRTQLGQEGIQCPGVLVVGAQSAGKSSVLERLTGISIPRGENLCTRFPTVVQLQTNSKLDNTVGFVSTDADFKDAEALPAMDNIKETIISCSEKQGSNGATIADTPIHIRYIRPTGPVMTLIDLPGITHVCTTDEHFDIHSVTAGMVESYVKNENMVVLVVIPANDDFGNSEALRITQRYDKNGSRTIGVVSKCDLVPAPSDVVQKIRMIRDSDVRLSLGFVAVRNKGSNEEEIDIDKSEKELFSSHSVLRQLGPGEWGYNTLSKKIVELQSNRVNQFIPEVQQLIQRKTLDSQQSLRKLRVYPTTVVERQAFLMSILVRINQQISELIKAESTDREINIASKTLHFSQEFAESVRQEMPDILGDEFGNDLIVLIKEASGYTVPNFIGETIFREKITDIFFNKNFQEKAEILIEDIADLMLKVFEKSLKSCGDLQPFSLLSNKINEECRKLVEKSKSRSLELARSIVAAEKSQIFTQNDLYINSLNEARTAIQSKQKEELEERQFEMICNKINRSLDKKNYLSKDSRDKGDEKFINNYFIASSNVRMRKGLVQQSAVDIQLSIHVYADILMKRLFDIIPMVIRHVMVHDLHSTFLVDLPRNFDDSEFDGLFQEEISIQQERKKHQASLQRMKDAQKKLKSLF